MTHPIDSDQFKKVLKYNRFGIKSGATLETGDDRLGRQGYYIKSTSFSNVKVDIYHFTLRDNSIPASTSYTIM